MKLLAEYGKFDWVVWSDESIFQLHAELQRGVFDVAQEVELSLHAELQRGVFEDLVRNTIVNASLPQLSMEEKVSWCGEPFQLLVLVSGFTVKSQLKLWNRGEYCRKACFPRLKSCFLKRNDQIFQQVNAPAHSAKTTKTWLENKSIRLMFRPGQSPYLASH